MGGGRLVYLGSKRIALAVVSWLAMARFVDEELLRKGTVVF